MLKLNACFLFMVVTLASLLVSCQQSPPPFKCTDTIGCIDIAPGEPIKLGMIQALSGSLAFAGIPQSQGIELALDKWNYQLLEHPIEIQAKDEACSNESGANTALAIVADPQIIAILGPTCSQSAIGAGSIMSKAGLVMISGLNVAPNLTATGKEKGSNWQSGYFRTIYNGADEGRIAAIYAFEELGLSKAATLNDGDSYSQGFTKLFEQTFINLGGEIVLSAAINIGDQNMKPVLTAVDNVKAEILFIPLKQPEINLIINQAKELETLKKVVFMGSDASLYDSFIDAVATNGVGMYIIGPSSLQGEGIKKLNVAYEAKYNQLPTSDYYAYAYDATNLLLNAIKTVAIQSEDGTIHIGRQALRNALYATANFKGVTGSLTCNQFGDCATGKFDIMRLDDPTAGVEGLKSNVVYTYNLNQ